MAAVNVLYFRDNSFSSPPKEKSTNRRIAFYKIRQKATKNLSSIFSLTYKQTADQAFHDAVNKIVLHSQLQNEIVNLEQQVLEAKNAT